MNNIFFVLYYEDAPSYFSAVWTINGYIPLYLLFVS